MGRQTQTSIKTLSGEQQARNRFVQVLEIARREKAGNRPLTRPSLAEEFYRENPMPWLLDSDPVDEPAPKDARQSA